MLLLRFAEHTLLARLLKLPRLTRLEPVAIPKSVRQD